MEIRRFFTDKPLTNGHFILDNDEFNHIVKVLRYRKGYFITICNNDGNDYNCIIEEITTNEIVAKVDTVTHNTNEPLVKLHLYQAVPKGDKIDLIIQKAVELGVSEITPVVTMNCAEKVINKDRLNKIILEASKQCGRAILPILHDVISFNELTESIKGYTVLAYEDENKLSIENLDCTSTTSVNIIVGSEGGFTESEVASLGKCGAISVSLGKRIMRAETASIVLMGIILYKTGGMSI